MSLAQTGEKAEVREVRMSGLQPLDLRVYPCVAPGDEGPAQPQCYHETCELPATGDGAGFFICAHEHITGQGDFCAAHWTEREYAVHTWHCSRCHGRKPGGGYEEWGHMCPMKRVLPERMSA
jgi:hypothetical protein